MSLTIDYTGPAEVVETMIKSGINKAALRP
ncbi:MAG: hypothetical protein JWN25_1666, partial [Verrucomicrobiales bacterium]|nr:hypothetical protein [Verrucomicrobiales bacterium]